MSFGAAAVCGRYVSGAQACMCCCRLLSLVWLPHLCSKALPSTSTSPRNRACHSHVPPSPWPPRPIYLAHFLHPPGGSLHLSVPESGGEIQLTVIILIVDHRRVIEASIIDDSTRKTLSMGVSPEKPVPWPAAAFVLSMAARNRFVSIKPDCHYCNAPEKRLDGVPPTQQEQFCRQCRCLGWQFVLDHVRCVSVFNECRGEVGSRLDLGPELVRAEFPILAAAHCPFASPGPDRHFHPVCIDRPPSHALYNNVVRRNPNENSISGDFRHKLCRDCSVRFAEEYAARWPEAEPLPPLETPAGELIALLVRH